VTAAQAVADQPTGWTLRVIWPIQDPGLSHSAAIALARADLPSVAARTKAVVVGEPTFRVVDCDGRYAWPTTPTAVVCQVEALPAVARIGHTQPHGRRSA
jgi:uncharacterized protein with von Willebrand factor type A (vWA) domain